MNYIQIITLILVLLPYVIITFLDFKYQEMYYWQIFVSILFNFLIIGIYNVIFVTSCKCVAILMPIVAIIWFALSMANKWMNKEIKIGRADIDVLASQALLLGLKVFVTSNLERNEFGGEKLIIFELVKYFVLALGFGFFIMIIISVIRIILNIKKYGGFKASFQAHRSVPSLLAFIPVICINVFYLVNV